MCTISISEAVRRGENENENENERHLVKSKLTKLTCTFIFLDNCNRTTGRIKSGWFSTKKVNFSCPVSRITLNVTIKPVRKKPVVLDATLNWKNPPREYN